MKHAALLICGGLMGLVTTISACLAGPPPISAFATIPRSASPSLSPDGTKLGIIQIYKGRPAAAIWKLDAPDAAPIVMPHNDGLITYVQWANNDRLLIRIEMDKSQFGSAVERWTRLASVDANGKHDVIMFANRSKTRAYNTSVSSINDLAPDDPDHIYMNAWELIDDRVFQNSLFRVDVTTGNAQNYLSGNEFTSRWVMDGNGHAVARIDTRLKPVTDHLYLRIADGWKEVDQLDADGNKGIDALGVSEDGKGLILYYDRGTPETSGYYIRDLASGAMQPFMPGHAISGVLRDPWTSRIIGTRSFDKQNSYFYFDPQKQALQKGLEAAFPGMDVLPVDWDRNRQKVTVSVIGPRLPQTYYLIDRTTHNATLIAQTYDGLSETDLGERKAYDYKARDGLDIPAFLTLPPGKDAKKLPVVVLPHGGPASHDAIWFDWEAQFLASRGYAVLQPNFRGSTGYGQAFMDAGYGQWGLKMQDDLTDGVKKLIADGIADPKRICIVGVSYGGYAALAGATFTPDLYACAASWGGVSDLRKFLAKRQEEAGSYSAVYSAWVRFIGDRSNDAEKLDATSPARNAEKIKIPVLLMHGTADSVVRPEQSETMEAALRHAGKKVTYIAAPNESHWMDTTAARTLWLTELEKFLKENIGN